MKILLTILCVVILSSISIAPVSADETHKYDKACPCDVDAAGNCLPCEEQRKKTAPTLEGDSIPNVACPCSIDAFGNCIPCKNATDKD